MYRRLFIALVATGLGTGIGLPAQRPTQLPPPTSAAPRALPMHPLSLFLPLAHARFFGDADLTVANFGPEPQHVTPAWFVGGRRVVGDDLDVAPHSSIERSIGKIMPPGVTYATVDGLFLQYEGHAVDQVAAQVTLRPAVGSEASATVDVPQAVGGDFRSTRLDGVWRELPDDRAVISVVNMSADPITVRMTSARATESLTLAGYTGRMFNRDAQAAAGGADWLRFEYEGKPAGLVATGFVFGAADHVPRLIHFSDPGRAVQPNLYGVGLHGNNLAVSLALRNTSEASIGAKVRLLDPDTGEPVVTLPSVGLPARDAAFLDLTAQTQGLAAIDRLTVSIENTGAPGSLIGDLHAIDRATALIYDVPLRDSGNDGGTVRRGTGNALWRYDGDYDTRITLTNVSTTPIAYLIHFPFGAADYAPLTRPLPPGASITFDPRAWRDRRTASPLRQIIPMTVDGGLCLWSIRTPPTARLAGRAEIVSVSRRQVSSYTW